MTNKDVIDIISDVIESLKTTSKIISITDNHNGTYTFIVDNLFELKANSWITITASGTFNNLNEKIISINSVNKSFVINKTTGATITTFGTVQPNKPFFDFGSWLEVSNDLTFKGQSIKFKHQMFPFCFLRTGFTEEVDINTRLNTVQNLELFFVTDTQLDSSSDWKKTNIFEPILRPFINDFITALDKNKYIHSLESNYEKKEYFDLSLMDNNNNTVNQFINAIKIKINFRYITNTINC